MAGKDNSDFDCNALTPQRISVIAAQLAKQSPQSLASITRTNTKRNGGYTPFVAGLMRAWRRVRVPPPPSSPTAAPSSSSTKRRPRQVSFAPTLTILVVKPDRSGLDVSHTPLPPDRPNSKIKPNHRRSRRPSTPIGFVLADDPSNRTGNTNIAYRASTPRAGNVRSMSTPRAHSSRRAQSDNFSSKVNRSEIEKLENRKKRPESVSLPVRTSSSMDRPPNVLRRRSTPRIESGVSSVSTNSTDSSAVGTDSDSVVNLKRQNKATAEESSQSPTCIQDRAGVMF